MAFIDEIKIYAKAGRGGNGVVRFRHEKNREFAGPSGGDGGRGGSIYALAERNVHLLAQYRGRKKFVAKRGEDGKSNSLYGRGGKDLDILLPVGSLITNLKTNTTLSLNKEGERVLLLKGGAGGRGNESFKSSINTTPKESTSGRDGEEAFFFIEVELIADIGFIGLPNAGKTSLLNKFTHASGKVGDYPFTTLEPNLGEYHGYIISDIPGLIAGAASGKGLGHKFLRHIKRTKILVHLISLENEDPKKAYQIVREELKQYNQELLIKPEIVVLTKADLVDDPAYLLEQVADMKKIADVVLAVSIYDDKLLGALNDAMLEKVRFKGDLLQTGP